MKKIRAAALVLGTLMVSSAALTKLITPTIHLSDMRPALTLENIIPAQFGDWKEEKALASAVINPQTEAAVRKVYTQTLSRTYMNSAGKRIMLSIAYGRDQGGETTQAHRPEICYTAQGFQIKANEVGELSMEDGNIPVRKLVAVSGMRNEPITYWMTVGDRVTLPGLNRKLAQLSYGLNGQVPDGLLFRVSSIQPDSGSAFILQGEFVNALFARLDPNQKSRLAGKRKTENAVPVHRGRGHPARLALATGS